MRPGRRVEDSYNVQNLKDIAEKPARSQPARTKKMLLLEKRT
jgi:hypothetical protein